MSGAVGNAGSAKSGAQATPVVAGLQISTSTYGLPIPLVWGQNRVSGNLLWYGSFRAVPVSSGGGKGGGGATPSSYTYYAAGVVGLCEGGASGIAGVAQVWNSKNPSSLAALGIALYNGTYAQAPWGYLTTGFPSQAIGYSGIANVCSSGFQLSSSAQMPNILYEVQGLMRYGTQGQAPFTVSIGNPGSVLYTSVPHGFSLNQAVQFSSTGSLPAGIAANTDYYAVTPGNTPVNFNVAANLVLWPSHGLVEGSTVQFVSNTNNLPSPLIPGATYYVIASNFTINQFEISATPGGAAVALSGSPMNCLATSPNTFWIGATPYQYGATSGNPTPITLTGGSGTLTVTPFIQGANPSDVITSFIADPVFGVNSYASSSLIPLAGLSGAASSFSNYCVANGIFISPALTTQQQAAQFITEICDITNSAPVWSQGSLKIIPYGDTAATGNGVTFTPNTTVQFNFTDDDFLDDGSSDPVTVTRGNPADAFNQVQVTFSDRTQQYNPNVATATDQASIDLYGLRPMPMIQHNHVTDAQVARNVAQVRLQRVLYIRNTYQFRVGWKYAQLEPMDLISITDAALGLNAQVVRITQIEEDEDEQLSITAEDYLINNATVQSVAPPVLSGNQAMMNADPGQCNTPVIFDAPGVLTTSGYELWMAVSGGPNWGGCQVWVSTDGFTYALAGAIHGGARYGQLTANFNSGVDPDTVDTCAVDLMVSSGILTSGSSQDADNHSTLALVYDGAPEIIAFSTATLTAASKYNLTGYIRRGVYNTPIGAHSSGAPFVRLDDSIFKYAYDPSWVGKEIFIKLLPFNLYGGGGYSLAQVSPVSVTIDGSISYPSNVTGYAVGQNGANAVFAWNLVPDPASGTYIAGYEIRYNPQGNTNWAAGTPISRTSKGTEITTAALPPGNWTTLICSVDKSGNYSVTPTRFDIDMVNSQTIVYSQEQDGAWLGACVGLIRHWTGILVPDSQNFANTANNDGTALNDAVFNNWVWNPVINYSYETPEQNLGFVSPARLYATVASQLGLGVSSGIANPALELEYSNTSGSYPNGYQAWTIGTVTGQYFKMKLTGATAAGLCEIASMDVIADIAPYLQSGTAVTVAPGGTTITFPQQYHQQPLVTLQSVGGGGLIPEVSAENTTQFTTHVFNTSGSDVGGTINWTALGV